MFEFLLSASLGILTTKIISKVTNETNRQLRVFIYIIAVVTIFALAVVYTAVGSIDTPPDWYQLTEWFFKNFNANVSLQIVMLALVLGGVIFLSEKEKGYLSFKQYSKKIRNFTSEAQEGNTITIVAGDMDFLGYIQTEEGYTGELMDNNLEYRQLLEKRNGIKLRILCSLGLDSQIINSIEQNTTSPKRLYSEYRAAGNLKAGVFQQLLRIGKISTDFGRSVEIRFYDSHDEYTQKLRGRFINEKGIVYQKVLNREDKYSIEELNANTFPVYYGLFLSKWNEDDVNTSTKIVRFCELLYHFTVDKEIRYKMALIYVNSYEIARKGRKRKEFPPFGVMYLAAAVRNEPGWSVDIISVDEHIQPNQLKWDKYDVIGFSIISSYSYEILKNCYDACKKRRDVVILAGGYQAEKYSNEVFRDFAADIIFKGEGEDSIRSFCQHYKDRNYSEIEGIIYKDSNNSIIPTKGRGQVDLDKILPPARDLLPTNDIVMTDRLAGTDLRMVHMLFSRGCPGNCYYCAANQNGKNSAIRYRNKIKIVEELNDLKEQYDIQGFSIIDDCFLTDSEKAIEICEYIAENDLGLKWSLAARVDNITEKILDVLKRAGCIEIKFGVETGSDQLLQAMHKGKDVTVECAENAIRLTKQYGINVKLFIITGLPGETDETHNQTKQFLEKMYNERLVDRISLLRFTPLAGSYIYDHPDKFEINEKMLQIKYFNKMSLYKRSFNWWNTRERLVQCDKWYRDMQDFITSKPLWKDC